MNQETMRDGKPYTTTQLMTQVVQSPNEGANTIVSNEMASVFGRKDASDGQNQPYRREQDVNRIRMLNFSRQWAANLVYMLDGLDAGSDQYRDLALNVEAAGFNLPSVD